MKKGLLLLVAMMVNATLLAQDFEKLPAPSSFGADQIARDPFARVDSGRVAEPVSIAVGAENAEEAQLGKFFKVTAISIDRLSIALINGTAVAEGEAFSVQTRGGKLRLRLLKVKQNGVVLKSSGTIFNVSLTR
jgi:hypothetical protein